jgi:YidC/Oxa1 family membrane protein insertase
MELAPHVAKLKEKHKNDNKTFFAEQQRLYKEHGISQQAGCLATLAQLPVLFALYQVLNGIFFVDGKAASSIQQIQHINANVLPFLQIHSPLNTDFFSWSLAAVPSHVFQTQPLIFLVPIITGVLSFIQTKMMSPIPVKAYKSDSPKELKEKQEKGDMASQMQGQMLILAPLMIGFFSFGFPIGLSLYWNTSTIFGIIQQYKIGGWGGMTSIWQIVKKPYKN